MRKPSIPSPQGAHDRATARILQAMKENIEAIVGGVGGEVEVLPPTASTAEVIGKINEIIRKLNRSGT